MNLKIVVGVLVLLSGTRIYGQDYYVLFKKAITELHTEYQAKKIEFKEKYEVSKLKVDKYPYPKPQLLVIQASEVQNPDDELKDMEISGVDQTLVEEVPPPTIEEISQPIDSVSNSKNVHDGNTYLIDFTSEPMFPGEPTGLMLFPRWEEPPASDKDKWVALDDYKSVDTIRLEDIKDPVAKQRWQDFKEHETNVAQLNTIALLEAIYAESGSRSRFNVMRDQLDRKGYSLENTFRLLGLYKEEDQQVKHLKGGILRVILEILGN